MNKNNELIFKSIHPKTVFIMGGETSEVQECADGNDAGISETDSSSS